MENLIDETDYGLCVVLIIKPNLELLCTLSTIKIVYDTLRLSITVQIFTLDEHVEILPSGIHSDTHSLYERTRVKVVDPPFTLQR